MAFPLSFSALYALIGPVGLILIAIALFALFLILRVSLYLTLVWRHFRRDFLDLENQKGCALRRYTEPTDNPLIMVVREIVTTHGAHSNDLRAEVNYLFHVHFRRVNNSLCWLKLIASVTPLLGLTGTALGMVEVFRAISDAAIPDPAVLAGGIWTALLTTILGLFVAVPALTAYYWLTLRFKGFRIEAVEHSYRALEIVRGIHKHLPEFDEAARCPVTGATAAPSASCCGESPCNCGGQHA